MSSDSSLVSRVLTLAARSMCVVHCALCHVQARQAEINNGVMHAAFVALFKDLIRLFACYNDAVINLLSAPCSQYRAASAQLAMLMVLLLLLLFTTCSHSQFALQASSST